MTDQTLQQSKRYENNQLQWGITERVFEIKPENRSEDMDYWFGKNKITASTQIRGIRFRGIRTTQDVGDSVKWKMFEDTLQNWDIRYDNVDRKIKAYSTDYNDFSHIPLRDPTVSRLEWEYVIYNWILYQCLDSSNRGVPWYLKSVLQYQILHCTPPTVGFSNTCRLLIISEPYVVLRLSYAGIMYLQALRDNDRSLIPFPLFFCS